MNIIKKISIGLTLALLIKKSIDILSRPKKMKSLSGKVVVITGASKGIGKAYSIELAKLGCKLVISARGKEGLEVLAKELKEKYNSEVLIVSTDVSKQEDCQNLIEKTLDQFDHIDILINNAGTSNYETFCNENIDQLRKIMDINYWGMVYCTKAALPSMMQRNKGRIVNVSSFAGRISSPGMAHYSATKHAMNAFTEGVRMEVSKYNINLNIIAPTSTKTEIVANSMNNNAFKLDPENYVGMTPERVAKETINAILDNKNEHIIGAFENFTLLLNKISPNSVQLITTKAAKLFLK